MVKKFVAYKGSVFTIEWFYNSNDKSQALEYFQSLSEERKDKLVHLFYVLGDTGKIRNIEKFRNEGDQIYAFKSQPDRLLCFFFAGGKVIITNGFEKKSDKLPAAEKIKALNYKKDYFDKVKIGKYYE